VGGREYGFPKEDMRGVGVGKDGGRGDGTKEGSRGGSVLVLFVVIGIVRFQRIEGIRVGKTRGRCARNYSRDWRKCSMGEMALKVVKGLTRTVGGSVVGPSSDISIVGGGLANRECGGGPGYYGWGLHNWRGR
jgi:hypothetical protein